MRILTEGTEITWVPAVVSRKPKIIREEEQFVLKHGAADGGAELVLVEDTLGNIVVLVGPGVSRAILVLVEGVKAAVELVGSGLGDQ